MARTYRDVLKNSTFQAAAALSYYSILCIFPALIILSAVMSYIPLPGFFQDALVAMGRVVPPGTMPIVDAVLKDISAQIPAPGYHSEPSVRFGWFLPLSTK